MKKRWMISLSVLLAVTLVAGCFLGKNMKGISIQQDNFPLSQKWSTRLDGKVAALSIVGDQIALIRTKSTLYALDIQTGKALWSQDLPRQTDPGPAIANNEMVYVVGGNILKALNRVDGSVIWQKELYFTGLVMDVSESLLVVKDGKGIHVYNASTGDVLQNNAACRTILQAYINGASVFVPCDGILRIDILTDQTSWWEENQGVVGNVGYGHGVMYFSQAEPNIVALDLKHWKELWRITMEIDGFESFDVYNDFVFYTDFSKLCALKRSDGFQQWCIDDLSYPQSPSVVGEVIYVFDGEHKEVTALNVMTGSEVGKLHLNNLNYFSTYQQLMASSGSILLFANGRDVFAFE